MDPKADDQSNISGNVTLDPDGALVTVFLDAATRRLDTQFSTFVALDAKIANVLSVGSAILPVTFGLLGLSKADLPLTAAMFLVLAGVAYVVLLSLSWLTVSKAGGLAAGAQIGVLRAHVESAEYTDKGLRFWVAKEYESSIQRNEKVLFLKVKYVGRASYALYVESALLSLAGVVSLLLG